MNKRGIATALVLAIIFGLTTVGLGTYIVYDNVKTSSSEVTTTESTELDDSNGSNEITVPIDDSFAFWTLGDQIVVLKIDNGSLYSYARNVTSEVEGAHANFDSGNIQYEKLLDNVKRIKSFHTRTDALPTFYAILNDGTVKEVAVPIDDSSYTVKVSDISTFNNYKVEDILNTNGEDDGFTKVKFEIKLQYGSTTKIE